MMRSDEVRINGEPQDSETIIQVVLPNGLVPFGRTSFQQLAAPDVVHKRVNVAVILTNPLREIFHLFGLEMIDRHCNSSPAEMRDEFGGLLNCFGALILGPSGPCCSACADNCGTGFAKRGGNATTRASG